MALIEWNDTLSVQVAEIDQQHKKLIDMINQLNDAMMVGKGKDALSGILSDLIRYTRTHFSTEEKYFNEFAYPDAEQHITEHMTFTQKVGEFKQKLDSSALGLSIEVMNYLSDWLKHHILSIDKKYSAYFNQHGLN